MVRFCAAWFRLVHVVQFDAEWCRMVRIWQGFCSLQVCAGGCSLVQFGANWYSLMQLAAGW